MAIRGINMIEEFKWSSKDDDGVEGDPDNPKTLFYFGGIDATIRTQIMDNQFVYSTGDDGRPANIARTGLRNIELVRFMLRRVEHYRGPDGKEISLDFEDRFTNNKVYKVATEQFISTLPPQIIGEMGTMLIEKISASVEQRKN